MIFPGKAIWKKNGYDIPIIVIKFLGRLNGENWYLIKSAGDFLSGSTGVPESELLQKQEK